MITRRDFVAGMCAAGLGTMVSVPALAQAESTMARIKRTKVLRTGFVAGAAPYFVKSVATGEWQGFCVDFAKQLAASLGVQLQVVDTTWGNSVLDLQSNKIDCMFGLAPTEARKKTVGFTSPLFLNTFTLVARKGFDPKTWADVDKPSVRLSVDQGSNQDTFATQSLSHASLRRFETSGDATLALQTGRVDAQVLVVLLAVTVLSKSPQLGHLVVPSPQSTAPTAVGLQKEDDPAFMNYLNDWLSKQRASGNIRKTILDNMQKLAGIDPKLFPKEVTL
ncbi:transporter substrate-binding domain-containing protein [Trinickia dinghuensis]|uniref:transporter substrate-binding domain-containing protein n=1 Tax=Trinickia dinghuensis TaxID=2291023 RepID=UPI0015F1A6E5|nr:transporter substrate-binding domain-containing protein [Trinickia dinghuensis]